MFGVTEPGCYGLVDVGTGKATLFVPHLPDEYAVWMGTLLTLDDFKLKYEVDEVCYVEEVSEIVFVLHKICMNRPFVRFKPS
jgi:Xaa-Pro dipeptidase